MPLPNCPLPIPLSHWGGDIPSPKPTLLGAFGASILAPKDPCFRWGSRPPREGAICATHWKTLGVSGALYTAKGIIRSSITARHAMRPFVNILWPFHFLLSVTVRPHQRSSAQRLDIHTSGDSRWSKVTTAMLNRFNWVKVVLKAIRRLKLECVHVEHVPVPDSHRCKKNVQIRIKKR